MIRTNINKKVKKMAEGTKDVTTDLQARTDLQTTDRLLMVNPVTKEVQYVEVEKVNKSASDSSIPTSSDETFIMV